LVERKNQFFEKFTNTPFNGKIEVYWPNGHLKEAGTIKNGKKDNLWEYYHENGKTKEIEFFTLGILNGTREQYGSGGQLYIKATYKDGKLDGPWIYIDPYDGWLYKKGQYKHGKKNGTWTYYTILGDIEKTEIWKNGLKINMNCGSTNLEPLKKALKESPADMGFSFDGDADRVIGLDSKGNVLDGDHILFLWGRELMEQKILTNNLLVSTQMANLGFEKSWKKIGGILHRTDVGDKYVHNAIKKKRAVLGGEQSGHILSKINDFSGDGILAALQISKFCKQKNINLNDWLKSSFEPYSQKLTNINLNFNVNKLNPETKILIDQTIDFFQKIYSDNSRVYIRPSGTEPVMRVLVEAKNHKKVHSLSSEITNKLFLEIDKIIN